jgi:hypothetical protein
MLSTMTSNRSTQIALSRQLRNLEVEGIFVLRNVLAEFQNPVMHVSMCMNSDLKKREGYF